MTILAAQIDQVEAMLTLVSDKLARATLVAPFDGVVVSGDLHQLLGTPVELGKVLFQIAPLDAYREILQVDERDIAYLQVGQAGRADTVGNAERVHGFLGSADYTCIYRARRPQLFPGRGAAPRALGNRASQDGGRRQDRRRRTHADLGLDAQFRQRPAVEYWNVGSREPGRAGLAWPGRQLARVGYLGVEPAGFQWRPPNATSVTQGSTFSFSYVVKDIGTAAAGSSWAGIYLDGQSASNELSGSAGYNSIAGMAANGEFVTASNSFGTAGLSVGQHTMWIKADYYNNLVSESDETNNWKSVTFNVTAPPLPDLVVNSITPNATSVTQGSTFSFSYVVKDIGTAAAGSSWAGIYLDGQSASNELSGSAGYNSIAGMAANGGFVTASNSFGTAGLSVGQHTLWIKADYYNNLISEGDETNNWKSVTFSVIAPPLPDLVVNSITPNATSVTQGSTFSFSYVVKDIGTASAGSSWAGIYLDGQSASNELSGSAGYNSIAGIAANGEFVTASNSFGTAGLSVSQHTLWIKAGYWNSSTGQTGNGNVSESNETNNWNSVTFTVTAPPHPQAAASAPSQPDASNPLTADALAPTSRPRKNCGRRLSVPEIRAWQSSTRSRS